MASGPFGSFGPPRVDIPGATLPGPGPGLPSIGPAAPAFAAPPPPPLPTKDDPQVETWFSRIDADARVQKAWEESYRTDDCYSYWRGRQRSQEVDLQGDRKAVVNLIHPQVRAQLPALYFYRPFGRVSAEPSRADTSMSDLPERSQLLQDTGNFLVRAPETMFRQSTFLALKEHFWAYGVVECGYSAEFADDPGADDRPPLKENEDTEVEGESAGDGGVRSGVTAGLSTALAGSGELDQASVAPAPTPSPALSPLGGASIPPAPAAGASSIDAEIARLESRRKSEKFFVKFISAKNVMVSASDRAILEENDWVGYWEDCNLEDVKRSKLYRNTKTLKASVPKASKDKAADAVGDDSQFREASTDGSLGPNTAEAKTIRLYKIWDLRTRTKIVLAHNHKQKLLTAPFKRCPLKFLRPDIDPYHFRPVPPIYNGLDAQEQYNNSLEYLRKTERATKARWTYDKTAVTSSEIEKFENDDANYIPREGGTVRPVEPIDHPQFTQLPLQMIALAERAFAQATGVSAENRQAETGGEKTATQAMIQNTAGQIMDSFDRSAVAEWLASIIEELILLARDNMTLSRWIAINVDPESPQAMIEALKVMKSYKEIKADTLDAAMNGISWHVSVDVESVSPVAKQEQLQRMLQMLNFIGNSTQALLLSRTPILLDRLLDLADMHGGRDRDALLEGLAAIVGFAQQQAAAGAGAPPGLSPMPGAPAPSARVPAPAPGATPPAPQSPPTGGTPVR